MARTPRKMSAEHMAGVGGAYLLRARQIWSFLSAQGAKLREIKGSSRRGAVE